MGRKSQFTLLFIFAFFTFIQTAVSEGTKQLSPTSNDIVMLHTNASGFADFAAYDGDVLSRMHVHIEDFNTETLYIGFSAEADNNGNLTAPGTFWFRIKDPDGVIVHGPYRITTSNDNTQTWDLATAGPDVLDPMNGYTTAGINYAVFDPSIIGKNGDYYIEFSEAQTTPQQNIINVKWFDLTVVAEGVEQPGRLWSNRWALRTPQETGAAPDCEWDKAFEGQFYSYTNDGFVSLVDFAGSQFQGLSFTVAFGEAGPGNTGDVIEDRKSVNMGDSTATAADHKVFLNDPDSTVYTSSTDVCGTADFFGASCQGDDICILVGTTQEGQVEILLDFFGNNGTFDPNSTDVLIAETFNSADTACILWNRLKGDGSKLAFNEQVSAIIRYSQGIQHYAAYDVEFLKNGFCVETVRPTCSGMSNLLYWDDSNITNFVATPTIDESDPGTGQPLIQLSGCNCGVSGCRTWDNFQTGTNPNDCDGPPAGYGDERTLNTWWFAASTTIGPVNIPVLQALATGDTLICSGDSSFLSVITSTMGPGYTYGWTGPSGFSSNMLDAGFVSEPGDYIVVVMDPNTGCVATDTIGIEVAPPLNTELTFECVMTNQPNADIDLTVSGGIPPYSYSWSNFAISEDLFNVDAGFYTVTVTDDLGCEAIDTITVQGCCELVINCPPAIVANTFSCITNIPTQDTSEVVIIDYCEPLTVDITDTNNGAVGCADDTLKVTRTYTVLDGGGNSATCVQTINVVDDVPPAVQAGSCPSNTSILCEMPIGTDVLGIPSYMDFCAGDNVVVTFRDESVGFDGTCTAQTLGQIQRTFFGADPCGNIDSSCLQIISIIDNIPPEFVLPADAVIDCTSDSLPSTTGTLTGITDNCSSTSVDFSDFVVSGSCPVIDTIFRTWSVSDACGNVATDVQIITRTDNQPPVFNIPADIVIDCTVDSLPANTGNVTGVMDDCSSTNVTFSDVVTPGDCPVVDIITRTWEVSDACGNTATDIQTITRTDNTPPSFTLPADVVINCNENADVSLTGDVTDAADLCLGFNVTFSDATVAGVCPATDTIYRTWVVTDICDNETSGVQVITKIDTVAPTVTAGTCPIDFTNACDEPLGEIETPDFSDNCSGVSLFIGVDSIGFVRPSSEGEIIRTFYLTDDCGNVDSSCTTTIFVVDNIPPGIICPPNVTIQCETSTDTMATGSPILTDNCGNGVDLGVTFTDALVGFTGGCGNGIIERTFTGSDPDGNDATCVQQIFVVDDILPVFDVPASMTVDCDIDLDDLNLLGDISNVTDCSDIVNSSYTDMTGMITCSGMGEIFRTWSVTDACGNIGTAIQMIFIQDTVPPMLQPPADVVISCEQNPQDTSLTGSVAVVSDACSMNFMLSYEDDLSGLGDCNGTGVIIRRWNASDECGNMTIMEQTITVVDNTPPVAFCNDITLDFYTGQVLSISPDEIDNGSFDNCGDVSLSLSQSVFDCTTFRDSPVQTAQLLVADDCGNVAPCTFSVTGFGGAGIIPNCPSTGVFVHLGSGECEAIVNYTVGGEPECGNFEIVAEQIDDTGFTSGDLFEIGEYFQEYIIYNIPDETAPPDLVPDTFNCAFTIFVIENEQITDAIVCNNGLNISFDASCEMFIGPDMILEGDNYGCFDDFYVEVEGVAGGLGGVMITIDQVVLGQIYIVSVTDTKTGNSCWSNVRLEYKFPPFSECGDRTILCTTPIQPVFSTPTDEMLPFAPTAGSDCLNIMYDWDDEVFEGICGVDSIYRTWIVEDDYGNDATCVQRIFVLPATFDALDFPEAHLGPCDGSTSPTVTGYPTINGESIINNPQCNIMAVYDDQEFTVCGASTKIVRRWRVINWCTQEQIEGTQIIKLSDEEGPDVVCPESIEVATDFWYCHASVSIPEATAVDACGSDPIQFELSSPMGDVTAVGGHYVISEMPLGTSEVVWTATDDCGNSSSCTLEVTVKDNVAPTMNCDLHTIVSLTNDGPRGITLVDASTFDDGSYDNCSDITFRARRMTSCIDFDWTSDGAGIDDIPNGVVNILDEGRMPRPKVPFACCDVQAGPIMVELEATDAAGNINYCMVEIEVQDKIAPTMECPPDIIVSCDYWFDSEVTTGQFINPGEDPMTAVFGTVLDAFDYAEEDRQVISINDPGRPVSLTDPDYLEQPNDWGIDGWAYDNCDVDIDVRIAIVDDCSGNDPAIDEIPAWLISDDRSDDVVRFIQRRFRAVDLSPQQNAASCIQNIWVVDFDPFYITDESCNNNNPNDGVIWPCDQFYDICPDQIDIIEPVIFDDHCSLIGVTYSDTRYDVVDSACYKILREWSIIDWCQFEAGTGKGIWKYVQVIKVIDSEGPVLANCPEGPVTLCATDVGVSIPENNRVFLGEDDPDASSCSVHIDVSLDVTEACSDYVIYDVKVYPFNGPDYLQLVERTEVAMDSTDSATLKFNTQNAALADIRENGLPYNNSICGDYHRVIWSIEDGCGNLTTCEYLLRLEDCKPPTPVCLNGLSTVVMPEGGTVTIWAQEYDISSIDDCTPSDNLVFSFSGDSYQPSKEFTCENVPVFGAELEVEIWVADEGTDHDCDGTLEWSEQNKDFCTTTIVITDNNGVCGGTGNVVIAGEVLTHDKLYPVGEATLSLSHSTLIFPSVTTSVDGSYEFLSVPAEGPYTISLERNDNHKNGVSTLDLVRMQKHLLGVKPFTSPYQYIAGDANNSESISVLDLVDVRKLILGYIDELPNNKSWRFVDSKQIFADVAHPWPFDEFIVKDQMISGSNYADEDFMAVKIGDLNNTVVANVGQPVVRNANGLFYMITNDREVRAGETVEVTFNSESVQSLVGFQFTLFTDKLEYIDVTEGIADVKAENIGVFDEEVTLSWHNVDGVDVMAGEALFTFKFVAKENGRLSEMLDMSSTITEAEAYDESEEIMDIGLTFRESIVPDFELYQNEPNPFTSQTLIGFVLPQGGDATLTVFDATGRVVDRVEGTFEKGYNKVEITDSDFPATGVLYYKLHAGDFSAMKKMIKVQ